MEINAFKMDGLGNDFVIIDQRIKKINLTKAQIIKICDRNFIGCDQLIYINNLKTTESQYLDIISDKTAQLFSAACKISAEICEVDEEKKEFLSDSKSSRTPNKAAFLSSIFNFLTESAVSAVRSSDCCSCESPDKGINNCSSLKIQSLSSQA